MVGSTTNLVLSIAIQAMDTASAVFASLTAQIDTLTASVDALNASLVGLDTAFGGMDATLASVDASLASVDVSATGTDTSFAGLIASGQGVVATLTEIDAATSSTDGLLTTLSAAASSAGASLASMDAENAGLATGLGGVGLAIAAVGVGLGLLGTNAVQAAQSFQATMLQTQALAGVTAQQAQVATAAIMQMSVAVGQTPQQLAQGLYYIASAGYNASDSLKLLQVSAEAAAVGNTDTETTANALTAAMSAFNIPASQAQQVMDGFVATVSNGKTEFKDFATVIGSVAVYAKQAGVSLQEGEAAFSVLTNVMPSAKMAKDALDALLQTSSRFDVLTKRAQAMGLQFDVNAYQAMNLEQRLKYLQMITGGNELEMAKLLGRQNAMAAATILMTNNYAYYDKVLNSVTHSQGALETAFQQTSTGMQLSVARLNAAWNVFLVSLGTLLLPMLTGLVNALAFVVSGLALFFVALVGIEQVLSQSQVAGDIFIGILTGIAAALVPVGIEIVTASIPAFIAWSIAAWGTATALAAVALEALIAAAPFLLVGLAVAVVVAGFLLLYQYCQVVQTAVNAVGYALQIAWLALGELVTNALQPALDMLQQSIVSQLVPAWNLLLQSLEPLLPVVELLGIIIGSVLVLALDLLISVLAGVITALAYSLAGIIRIFTGIVQIIAGAIQIIAGIFLLFADLITGRWYKLGTDLDIIGQGIVMILQGVWNIIVGIFQTAFGLISGFIDGFLSTFIGFIVNIYYALGGTQISGALLALVGLFSLVADLITGRWDQLGYDLANMTQGIVTMFQAAFNFIVSLVQGFVMAVINFFVYLYDVLVGHSIIPDLVNAIVYWFSLLPSLLLTTWLTIFTDAQTEWTLLYTWFTAWWSNFYSYLSTNLPGLALLFMAEFQLITASATVMQASISLIFDLVTGRWSKLNTDVTRIEQGMVAMLQAEQNIIDGLFQTEAQLLTGTLLPAFQQLTQYLSAQVNPAFQKLAQTISAQVDPAFTQMQQTITGTLLPVLTMLYMELQSNLGTALLNVQVWVQQYVMVAFAQWAIQITGTLIPDLDKLNIALGQVTLSLGKLNVEIGLVTLSFGKLDLELGHLDLSFGKFNLALGQLNTSFTRVNTPALTFDHTLSMLNTDLSGIPPNIQTATNVFGQMDTELGKVALDGTAASNAIRQLNTEMGGLQAPSAALVVALGPLALLMQGITYLLGLWNQNMLTLTGLWQAFVYPFPALIPVWNIFLQQLNQLINLLQGLIPGLFQTSDAANQSSLSIYAFANMLGIGLTLVVGGILTVFSTFMAFLTTFIAGLNNLAQGVNQFFAGIIQTIQGGWNIIVGTFTGNGALVKQGWDSMLSGMQTTGQGALQGMQGIWQASFGALQNTLDTFGQSSQTLFSGLMGNMNATTSLGMNQMNATTSAGMTQMSGITATSQGQFQLRNQQMWAALDAQTTSGMGQMNTEVTTGLGQMSANVSKSYTGMQSTVQSTLSSMALNVKDSFDSMNTDASTASTSLGLNVQDSFTSLSNTLVGHSIVPDMVTLITQNFTSMQTSVQTTTSSLMSTLQTDWNSMLSFLTGIGGKIVTAIESPFQTAISFVTGLLNGLQTTIGRVLGLAHQAANATGGGSSGNFGGVASPPGFASGIEHFTGGLAYVHQGEVLMNLSPGTSVIPARNVRMGNGSGSGGGGDTHIHVTVNAPALSRRDASTLADALSRELASRYRTQLGSIAAGGSNV